MFDDPISRKTILLILTCLSGLVFFVIALFIGRIKNSDKTTALLNSFIFYSLILVLLVVCFIFIPAPYGRKITLISLLVGSVYGYLAIISNANAPFVSRVNLLFLAGTALSGLLGAHFLFHDYADRSYPLIAFALAAFSGVLITRKPVLYLAPLLLSGGIILGGLHWPNSYKGPLFIFFLFVAGAISATIPVFLKKKDELYLQEWVTLKGLLAAILFAVSAYIGSSYILQNMEGFWCAGMGILSGLSLILFGIIQSPKQQPADNLGGKAGLILILFAQIAVAFILLGGYGIALLASGLLFAFPYLYKDNQEAEANFIQKIFVPVIAFTIFIVYLRIYLEELNLVSLGIDLVGPYSLIALALGIFLPRFLIGGDRFWQRGILVSIAIAIPLVVGVLWRSEALGAYLLGGAVSILLQENLHIKNDDSYPAITQQGFVSPLMLIITPHLFNVTFTFSRMQKIYLAVGVVVLALLWSFVIEPIVANKNHGRQVLSSPVR